jgi:hypothetical protein
MLVVRVGFLTGNVVAHLDKVPGELAIWRVYVCVRLIKCARAKNSATFKGLLSTANACIFLGMTYELGASALAMAAVLNSIRMVLA